MFSIPALILLFNGTEPKSAFLIYAEQTSGYTRMEDAFQNFCALQTDGTLKGIQKKGRTEHGGWTEIHPFHAVIQPSERDQITALLKAAENGPFLNEPGACDTGSLIIKGQIKPTPAFSVVEYRDCESSIINQSESAKKIEAWVMEHCKFVP